MEVPLAFVLGFVFEKERTYGLLLVVKKLHFSCVKKICVYLWFGADNYMLELPFLSNDNASMMGSLRR